MHTRRADPKTECGECALMERTRESNHKYTNTHAIQQVGYATIRTAQKFCSAEHDLRFGVQILRALTFGSFELAITIDGVPTHGVDSNRHLCQRGQAQNHPESQMRRHCPRTPKIKLCCSCPIHQLVAFPDSSEWNTKLDSQCS